MKQTRSVKQINKITLILSYIFLAFRTVKKLTKKMRVGKGKDRYALNPEQYIAILRLFRSKVVVVFPIFGGFEHLKNI